jgi:microcystin-dependent protein
MSKHAWITPAENPETFTCFRVYCPASIEHEAALRGALLLLQELYNWEKVGATTPADCAQLWLEANAQTFFMQPCCGGGQVLPIGMVFPYAGSVLPDGCLACDGSELDTTEYADLFAAIGYTYGGSGDVFLLPDLRNQFVAGAGDNYSLADSGGEDQHTLIESELASHFHFLSNLTLLPYSVGSGKFALSVNPGSSYATAVAGSDTPHENRPPFVALTWCIVATEA